jgi:hypothetical protein
MVYHFLPVRPDAWLSEIDTLHPADRVKSEK